MYAGDQLLTITIWPFWMGTQEKGAETPLQGAVVV